MIRPFVLFLLSAGFLLAQEPSPSPAPTADVSPTPIAPPTPEGVPAPLLEPAAAPNLVPAAEEPPPPAPDTPPPLVPDTPPLAPDVPPLVPDVPPPAPSEAVPGGASATERDSIPIEGGAPLDTREIAPGRPDEGMPDEAYTEPDALVPDVGPVGPPPAPVTFESTQEKARQLSIRYREVRVRAEKDPKVLSLREQAERARTLEDQRAAMREYYRLLFKKIISIDKSLTEKCKVMETAYLRRLAQERLEPTIPLNPPPTPEPLN
jgi:hypothetical protein